MAVTEFPDMQEMTNYTDTMAMIISYQAQGKTEFMAATDLTLYISKILDKLWMEALVIIFWS